MSHVAGTWVPSNLYSGEVLPTFSQGDPRHNEGDKNNREGEIWIVKNSKMNLKKDLDTTYCKIDKLKGAGNYLNWRRNARAVLIRSDRTLLGLKPRPENVTDEEMKKWEDATALVKSDLTLMLSDEVQIRAHEIIDDDERNGYELWNFLESTYTASNEQAVQNLRVKLDSLKYVEGTDWEKHLNKFNHLISLLAIQNVAIDEKQKKSLLIRTFPESLRVISTVSNCQPDMTVEAIDALVRAELDLKNNPNKSLANESIFQTRLKANSAQGKFKNRPKSLNRNNSFKKKGNCYYCGKPGHFKIVCRKRIADEKRATGNNRNKPRNSRSWGGSSNHNNNIQGLISSLQNLANNMNTSNARNQEQNSSPAENFFRGYMAQAKFRSNIAEISEKKTYDAYIDSGATHHFFHNKSAFLSYSRMPEEIVKGATGETKIVGKGEVKLPIGNGYIIQAYHVPLFSSNIISVGLLQKDFEIMFSESVRAYPACLFMKKRSFNIVADFPLENGPYPIKTFNSFYNTSTNRALSSKLKTKMNS